MKLKGFFLIFKFIPKESKTGVTPQFGSNFGNHDDHQIFKGQFFQKTSGVKIKAIDYSFDMT